MINIYVRDITCWSFTIWYIVRYIDITDLRNYRRLKLDFPWSCSGSLQCHIMLWNVMACHAMPCHAMPCHAMPFHDMPLNAMDLMLYPPMEKFQLSEYIVTIGVVHTMLLINIPHMFKFFINQSQRFRSSMWPCLITSGTCILY